MAVFGWQPSDGARFELWDRGDPGDKLTLDGVVKTRYWSAPRRTP